MRRIAIGVDLGGTNLRVAAVDAAGRRLAEHAGPVPADAKEDAEALLDCVAERLRTVAGSHAPVGIGLGIACALDAEGRVQHGMTNIPALAGRVPVAEIARRLALPVRAENDARAAVLGEARFGAARGVRNVLMLTLGTGIGGGLVLDGRLRSGPHGLAGEIGLSLMGSAAGPEPLEDRASPGGLMRTRGIDMRTLADRAARSDAEALRQLEAIAADMATAIVNAHVTLDLELVLLGGGMTAMGADLLDRVRKACNRLCPPAFSEHLAIEYGELDQWAGAMGAAALWFDDGRETT